MRIVGQIFHINFGVVLQLFLCRRGTLLRLALCFIILIEILVGIEIGGIGRQIEELDFVLMLFDPSLDHLGMVEFLKVIAT